MKFIKHLLVVISILVSTTVFAQNKTVRGTVTSEEDGLPVPGAAVFVKNTTIGAVTGADGKYTLQVPASATTLVFSCIGMIDQEKPVASVVDVVLVSDSEALEEAVITIAYGAAKRSSLTGAVASINSQTIEQRTTSSVTSALEGTIAGVQINNTYGAPGSDPSVRIRGIGTINGSSSPLYVVDGVPFSGNISDINPVDVESISVLKDAASAALYGNRASNGVILITTKSGKSGKVSLTVDIKQGVYERGIPEYALASADQFMELEWMNLKNYRMSQGNSAADAAMYASEHLIDDMLYLNIYNKPNNGLFTPEGKLVSDAKMLAGYAEDLDWYKDELRKGYRQEYNVSASGGTQNSDYYFSVGYLDENGYVSNSGFDRLSARAAVNVKPADWIKVGLNLSGSHQNYLNTNGNSDASYTNIFMYARQISPIYPVHLHDPATGEYILDANGNKQFDGGSFKVNGVNILTRNQYLDRHVIWENQLNKDFSVRNVIEANAYTELYLLKDFTFRVNANLNVRNNDNRTYSNAIIGDGKGNSGRAEQESYIYKKYQIQEQLRYNHQFGDHGVSALLGHENYSYNYQYEDAYKTTEVFPGTANLSNFTDMVRIDGYGTNYRTESYLARAQYNYQTKYNVEANFRRDGSSRFAKQSRWGNFFSFGANWMISKEAFMQPVRWVNSLKLRADYGEVANDSGAGYYGYLPLYSSSQNNNIGAYYLSQLPNYDLKWETSQSWGVGLESRLFNRWNLNVEYFDRRNKDLIFDVYQPLSAGATSTSSAESTVTKNIGTISTHGIEIETDFDIYRNRDWNINLGLNATFMKNKVVKLPEQNRENGILNGTKKIVEGKDIYSYFLYTFEGVDMLDGQSLYKFNNEDYYITSDNTATGTVLAGSPKKENGAANTLMSKENYKLINGKYYVNNTTYALREFHGTASPTVYGGINFNVSYKNLSLATIFSYSLGGYVYDGVYAGLMGASGTPSSIHSDAMNSWTAAPAGMTENSANRIDRNALPEFNYGTSSYNNGSSSRWLTSANYLIFKNLAINYQLPKSLAKACQMSAISVGITAENLFSLTARRGMNPQQSFSGTQSNALVTPRIITGQINFKF